MKTFSIPCLETGTAPVRERERAAEILQLGEKLEAVGKRGPIKSWTENKDLLLDFSSAAAVTPARGKVESPRGAESFRGGRNRGKYPPVKLPPRL